MPRLAPAAPLVVARAARAARERRVPGQVAVVVGLGAVVGAAAADVLERHELGASAAGPRARRRRPRAAAPRGPLRRPTAAAAARAAAAASRAAAVGRRRACSSVVPRARRRPAAPRLPQSRRGSTANPDAAARLLTACASPQYRRLRLRRRGRLWSHRRASRPPGGGAAAPPSCRSDARLRRGSRIVPKRTRLRGSRIVPKRA